MSAGAPIALVTVRVSRGQARPSMELFREAIDRDRSLLRLLPRNGPSDVAIAGPYPIVVDGLEMDEYVAWER